MESPRPKPVPIVGFMNSASSVALTGRLFEISLSSSFFSFSSIVLPMLSRNYSSGVFTTLRPKLFLSSMLFSTVCGIYFYLFVKAGRCSNLSVTLPRSSYQKLFVLVFNGILIGQWVDEMVLPKIEPICSSSVESSWIGFSFASLLDPSPCWKRPLPNYSYFFFLFFPLLDSTSLWCFAHLRLIDCVPSVQFNSGRDSISTVKKRDGSHSSWFSTLTTLLYSLIWCL